MLSKARTARAISRLLGRTPRFCALALAAGLHSSALAQPLDTAGGGAEEARLAGAPETSGKPAAQSQNDPSIASSLGPLGDPGGVRSALEARGITYSLTYIGEVLNNARGGIRQRSVYEGRLDAQLDMDLEKLAGLRGLAFHANGYRIHGQGLSRCCLENLLVASGIEALPSTRLYELYVEQAFGDRVTLRVGQLAADTEFLFSRFPSIFVNSTFGWPSITAVNLPSGGPSYPLATPGVRLKVAVMDQLTLRAAVFNGDPAGPAGPFEDPDPQRRNRTGMKFRLHDPAFLIGEARYGYNEGRDAAGLPGNVKIGAWAHLDRFDAVGTATEEKGDPTQAGGGADPESAAFTRRLRGNGGVYGILTQMIYRVPGSTDQGVGLFARLAGNPSDRNLISWYGDGGLTFKGMIPGRANDTFGVAFAYARISERARSLDQAMIALTGMAQPVRLREAALVATYQAEVVPGWTVQPAVQYIINPGGNVPNPRDPNGQAIKNALVFVLRTTIQY